MVCPFNNSNTKIKKISLPTIPLPKSKWRALLIVTQKLEKYSISSSRLYHRFSILRDHWGFFIKEKIVFRLPSIIPYMAHRQNFSCCKGFCVFKISVVVHNTYCVKCSLSYTADYTSTCPKSPVILWLFRR